MPRRRRHVPLNVFLNSRLTGRLTRETSGAVAFRYDPDWLAWEHAMPISLSLPLREDRYIGEPVSAVFENLLPDTDAIRRRVAERVGARGIDAFSLLSVVGRDCVGALQFLPEDQDPGPAGRIEGVPLSEDELAALIRDLAAAPLGLGEDDDFRISIAGAQEKTALLFHDGRWCKPVGATATTHILKPQIGALPNGIDLSDSVENEFFCLKLLEALGLPVAKAEIATFGDRKVLVVERFDRLHTKDGRLLRLPQEDCCQALSVPPTLKYQNQGGPGIVDILRLLRGADDPQADQLTFLKAQIAFWLIGATDGHAKNFSLFLRPGGRFSLTPLYDVISVQPSFAAGQLRRNQMKLAMSVGDNRHYRLDEIAPRHFGQTAEAAGLGATVAEQALGEVFEALPAAISKAERQFPQDTLERIVEAIVASVHDRGRLR